MPDSADSPVIHRFRTGVEKTAELMNVIAASAIMGMMLLTAADVVLRYFRRPITGAYEVVGFLGATAVGFALANTSVQRGHVAVSFLFQRLSRKGQTLVETLNGLVGFLFFGLLAWQCVVLGNDLKHSGEVSLTLQMPFYPFVFGVAAGCMGLCLVLIVDFIGSFIKLLRI